MTNHLLNEIHYRILKRIEVQPDISQRQLARELGVSLGKVNYCLRSLVDKGWIKINNFRRNPKKLSYAYVLTPQGTTQKAQLTVSFLQRKMAEYELIKEEIAELKKEVKSISTINTQD